MHPICAGLYENDMHKFLVACWFHPWYIYICTKSTQISTWTRLKPSKWRAQEICSENPAEKSENHGCWSVRSRGQTYAEGSINKWIEEVVFWDAQKEGENSWPLPRLRTQGERYSQFAYPTCMWWSAPSTFWAHDVVSYHKPFNILRSQLVRPKDKTPLEKQCGVCQKQYMYIW